ncbi:MAG: hypothetical protein ACXVA9_05870 [Bdellovibrionales bacterium]
MKGLIFSFAVLISSSAFADSASQMVKNTLTKGQQILSLKSTDARNTQMCALIKGGLNNAVIGPALLGSYMQLSSDKKGINLFLKQMTSMTTTKLVGAIGNASGAQIDVDDNSTDRGDGSFAVGITIHTANGNAYNGTAIVAKVGKSFKMLDAEYLGFSAVHYLGNDIQKKIDDEAATDSVHPITAFMTKQMADADYIHCN